MFALPPVTFEGPGSDTGRRFVVVADEAQGDGMVDDGIVSRVREGRPESGSDGAGFAQ